MPFFGDSHQLQKIQQPYVYQHKSTKRRRRKWKGIEILKAALGTPPLISSITFGASSTSQNPIENPPDQRHLGYNPLHQMIFTPLSPGETACVRVVTYHKHLV